MFIAASIILTVVVLTALAASGPRLAIALCWAGGLFVPSWIYITLGPIAYDLKTYGAFLAIAIAISSGRVLFGGWIWLDACVASLVVTQLTTEALCENLRLSTVVTTSMEWMLPYFLGRIAFHSTRDMQGLRDVGAWLCLLFAAWSIFESVSHVNPISLLIPHQGSFNSESELRWGLRRAEGPTYHPIFFGLVLVMLLPWAIIAADEARRSGTSKWREMLPWITALGVFFTMSRGPQIAAGIALLLFAFFRRPLWRKYLVAGVTCSIGLGIVGYSVVLDTLHAWSNEGEERTILNIKNQVYEYSGTNHRFLQLLVYEDAVHEAGWFGYGSAALIAIPELSPLPLQQGLPHMLRSIDNHYLHNVLRLGYIGVALFLLTSVLGVRQLIRPALTPDSDCSLLAAALCGSMVATLLLLTSVWLSPDICRVLLFELGVAASLRTYFNVEQREAAFSVRKTEPSPFRPPARSASMPRLAPGHPHLSPTATQGNCGAQGA